MRDLERWKDKVEFSLDGRQIFFLFFGSAVGACLLFVLGVLVGKRIEARALAMSPPPAEDPLAALDQLAEAEEMDDTLTFKKTLGNDKIAPAKSDLNKDKTDKTKTEIAPKTDTKVVRNEAKPATEDKTIKQTSMQVENSDKIALANHEMMKDKESAKDTSKEADKTVAKMDAQKSDITKSDTAKMDADAAKMPIATRAQVVSTTASKTKKDSNHFTLQLSAFPERADAEAFSKKLQGQGLKPFIVTSELPGKGTFFRVRVGDYQTRQAALDAKADFEKKQRMVAYVAKL